MARRHVLLILAVAALLVVAAGCTSSRARTGDGTRTLSMGCDNSGLPLRLDRGDWMVNKRELIWKAFEDQKGSAPRHVGYLVKTEYQQKRGGPVFDVYRVTTLNRRETIGRIDQVGRAYRFEPRRNAGFEEIDEGVGAMEESVGAIFRTNRMITLVETSEREIAFEMLDRDGDGLLQPEEIAKLGDRIQRADTNRDGVVDFQEFQAIDQL